jgi:hypothetical protein
MDSNLLKEAIADAKAVRATALANAKVALEEAFAPRFQKMLAGKLREEAGVAQEGFEQEEAKVEETTVNESEIDELIKELENEVGGEEGAGAPPMDAAAGGAEEPPMDAAPETPAPTQATLPVTITIQSGDGAAGAPPVPPVPPTGDAAGMGAPDAGMGAPQQEDEEVNLDELLESLKEESKCDEEDEEVIKESVPVKSSAIGGKVGGSDNKKPSADANATSHLESAAKDKVGGGEGYKSGPADATTAPRPNAGPVTPSKMDTPKLAKESVETGVPGGKTTSTGNDPSEVSNTPNAGPITPEKMDTPALTKENAMLKKQLAEATETVTYIKGQLNEINLLNAKLLYTNKLFKEFNVNNEQKMRVVEMFDLSRNVREVKLTYATIAESLNFSGDMKKKVQPSTSVQSITEGIASKPVGSTKPSKQIITEQSAMVSKFQKLAGIKKK